MSTPLWELAGRFPWSAGAMWALLLVGLLGLWLAADRRALAMRQAERCRVLVSEWESGADHWPMTMATAAAEQAQEVENQLERWRASMAGGLPGSPGVEEPRERSEAFFELDEFRTRMRRRAGELGVGLREGEPFGFAAYVHEGPADRLLGAVHRQRQMIEFLLEALFREPPVELRNVQRERPSTGRVEDMLVAPAAGGDYFAMDPQISARVPGLIDAVAVRLVFVGRTTTLKAFLAGIGGYGLPLIVRSVEAEDAGPLRTGGILHPDRDEDGLTQYTIIVELVQWLKDRP